MPHTNRIIVRRKPGSDPAAGILLFNSRSYPCFLGESGITTCKFEGDAKTPSGSYRLLFGFFRKDRLRFFNSKLPFSPLNDQMGWCDEPKSGNYNRRVKLPFSASHEKLMRDDQLYDLVIVLDHNYHKRTKRRGSAVFFHLTGSKGYTAGCVAVSKEAMLKMVPRLNRNTVLQILP